MKIKTSELTGAALDWAVAKCWWHDEFDRKRIWLHNGYTYILNNSDVAPDMRRTYSHIWQPSTDWSQGGPIIEREEIELKVLANCLNISDHPTFKPGDMWEANLWPADGDLIEYCGPTPLIAAMRTYVASKLGDEVEIPNELA